MNDKLLVTRPEFDTTTFYLSQWCKKPIDYARKIGIEIIDLQKEKADYCLLSANALVFH